MKAVLFLSFAVASFLSINCVAAPTDGPRYSLNSAKIDLSVVGDKVGPALPLPSKVASLTPSFLTVNSKGEVYMKTLPQLREYQGRVIGRSQQGDTVLYTVDNKLHNLSKTLAKQSHAPHLAIVAMDPKTGKILAMAEKSNSLGHALLHTGFPAASLFKVVTSAAALETSRISPDTNVFFRGGTYELSRRNYNVNNRYDKRKMTLTEGLAKSCNPVFGRVALKYLRPDKLLNYAKRFGFNDDLKFDIPLHESSAKVPGDDYGFSRTAAGFGDVFISPIHAAAMMAAVANNGKMPRPYVVEKIFAPDMGVRYTAKPRDLKYVMAPKTAKTLLNMMEATTKIGTARNDFQYKGRPLLPKIRVAGKTGTLRGKNPIGLNRWFIGAAPIEDPKIVVAVLAINPTHTVDRPGYIARRLISQYLTGK